MKRICFFLFALIICFNTRSQTASRVIAFARYGADTTIPSVDSGGYKYAHGNGGEIFPSVANYKYTYPFILVQPTDFETGLNGLVKCDSSWETGPDDTDISVQFFDENDNIIYSLCRIYKDGAWQNNNSQTSVYDANNNLIQQVDTSRTSGNAREINLSTNTYDPDNKLIQEINFNKTSPDSNWIDGGMSIYIYDSSGKLIDLKGNEWVKSTGSFNGPDSFTEKFTYTGNHPDSFINYFYNPSYGGSKGIYYFSPANDTMVTTYNDGENYARITTTYDSYHNIMSTEQVVLNPGYYNLGQYRDEWSYNAYNQVICQRYYSRDTTGPWIFTNLIRFYYETYTPEVPYGINTLTLFPSPANGSITVKLEWATPQPFTCAIFDAVGRLVMQWSVPTTRKYEQAINLPFAASGNYFFRATAGKEKMVKQFVMLN